MAEQTELKGVALFSHAGHASHNVILSRESTGDTIKVSKIEISAKK